MYLVLFLLQALDTVSTSYWWSTGLVYEANPFMDYLLNVSVWLFVGIKLTVAAAGTLFLWYCRLHAAARYAAYALFAVFSCLGLWHVIVSFMLWGGMQ